MQWTESWHMGFMWVLLALLLVAVLLMLARFLARAASDRAESPERILRRRYAAGEIDEETFERVLDKLSRAAPEEGEGPQV